MNDTKHRVMIMIPDSLKKSMGGMGVQCKHLIENFPDKNFYFDVLGMTGETYSEDNYSYHPIETNNIPIVHENDFLSVLLQQAPLVAKAFSIAKPSLIHTMDWNTFYAGQIIARTLGIPIVISIQLSIYKMMKSIQVRVPEDQKVHYELGAAMEMSGLMHADAIIQVSESYAKKFPKIFLPKTYIIGNGISLDEWTPVNKIQLPGSNRYKIIYIGRLAKMKNVHSLVQSHIPPEIDLIIIAGRKGSDNGVPEYILDHIKDIPNIHYVGPKYDQEKVDWLCAADAVIVPSLHEPFGIVALEALASKSILLSSFVDGMGNFLSEETALNCGVTPESISSCLCDFISMEEETKQKMITKGLELCEIHEWKIKSNMVYNLYKQLLSNTRNKTQGQVDYCLE